MYHRRVLPLWLFSLPANESHGFWVDLHVPAERAAGEYRGVYRVTADDEKAVEIPVRLTVWNFTLPTTPTLVTAFGSPSGGLHDYYRRQAQAGHVPEPKEWKAVEEQCAQLMSEHLLNATSPAEALRPL